MCQLINKSSGSPSVCQWRFPFACSLLFGFCWFVESWSWCWWRCPMPVAGAGVPSLFAGFLILISLSATAYHNKQHVNTYLKPQCSVTTSHNSLRATHASRFYVVTSSLLTAKWALKVRKTNMVLISVKKEQEMCAFVFSGSDIHATATTMSTDPSSAL